jgi:5-methylcytosine-specific restriction endonuclease McrA
MLNSSVLRKKCWKFHQRKCVVCGEEKILTVHHVNEDKKDTSPKNLVPLCPTHHQYAHSRYKGEIQHIIDDYVEKFILTA